MDTLTVTVIRPGGRDNFGNVEPVTSHQVAGCLLAPRGSDEGANTFANTVITGAELFTPPGADLLPSDRVVARGVTYDVEGEVGDWGAGGKQAALTRRTG